MVKMKVLVFNHVRVFATPWGIACQAPLPMEFSKQEYWSGLPFPPPKKEIRMSPKSLQMVIAAMKLKDAYFLERKL